MGTGLLMECISEFVAEALSTEQNVVRREDVATSTIPQGLYDKFLPTLLVTVSVLDETIIVPEGASQAVKTAAGKHAHLSSDWATGSFVTSDSMKVLFERRALLEA